MTNAYASMHGRSLASTLDARVTETIGRLRAAWTSFRAYRRTLAELRDLPTRALRDLDFNRGDLAAIAHRGVLRPLTRKAGASTAPPPPPKPRQTPGRTRPRHMRRQTWPARAGLP